MVQKVFGPDKREQLMEFLNIFVEENSIDNPIDGKIIFENNVNFNKILESFNMIFK